MSFSVGELSEALGTTLVGEPEITVNHIAPVERAGPFSITFVTGRKFLAALKQANPSAVIIPPEYCDVTNTVRLLTDDPYRCYAKLTRLWAERLRGIVSGSIHETAVVDADTFIHPTAVISAQSVIGSDAVIGEGAVIGAGCYVGPSVRIGDATTLHPNVTVLARAVIGDRCEIHSGAVIGADGFGWAPAEAGWEKICQLGSVKIGDRVSIGACTTVDRGAIEDTVIEDGVILDNHIQVAHNVVIGENTAIAGCTGIAGSTRIGSDCRIGGAVSIVGHIAICDNVTITANTFVNRSIRNPGSYSSGYPAEESKNWRKNAVRLQRLDELARWVFKNSGNRR